MNKLIEFEGCKVRILNEDGSEWDGHSEPWFVPVDIATAIGYQKPEESARNILNRNPERFTGLRGRINLVLPSGMQEVNVVNESGLYMFLMVARTEKAIMFQRKVTDVLKNIRKGKMVNTDSTALQAVKQLVGIVESHDNRIGVMENRMELVEQKVDREILITNRQATTIKLAANARIRELLKDDYKERSRQYFAWLYREIYARFAVPSYRDIPRKEFDAVLVLVKNWAPVQPIRKTS